MQIDERGMLIEEKDWEYVFESSLLDRNITPLAIKLPLDKGNALQELFVLLEKYFKEQFPVACFVIGAAVLSCNSWRIFETKGRCGMLSL